MPTRPKILISNTVPVNGGDAALLFALYEALLERNADVKIASYHFRKVASLYPELPLTPEGVQGWIYRKLPFLRYFVEGATPKFRKAYRQADVIWGCPGGYFNSYYGIRGHIAKLRTAAQLGKQTGIYSQSFGPLHGEDLALFKKHSPDLGLLIARDALSVQNLKEWGVDPGQVLQSNDAAFLLKPLTHSKGKGAAISVRRWSHESRSATAYRHLMLELARTLYRNNIEITFLSTCQGVRGYVDDSECAQEFAVALSKEGIPANVDRDFHRFQDLRTRLGSYELVVGTRLHFCILSMLSGTPALNISYESKGRECFQYMGLADYSVDYNSNPENAAAALQILIDQQDGVRQRVVEEVARQHKQAHEVLDQALATLAFSSM